MSGPPPLDAIDDPGWLEEAQCGLPSEAAEGPGLVAMVPGVGHWMNSSASTTGGRLADAVLGGAAGVGLSKAMGWIIHVPVVGSVVDAAVGKISKKLGFEFTLKGSVNLGVRSAVMAAEGAVTDQRAGAARLKAQAQIGALGGLGQNVFGGGKQGSGE